MKRYITYYLLVTAAVLLNACGNTGESEHTHIDGSHDQVADQPEQVYLGEEQFEAMGMMVDSLPLRNMSSYVEANGNLEVPPQNEANVTAIVGANVTRIMVIEGDKVSQGQPLAYVSHPNLVNLQTDYIESLNRLQYLEKEFERQERLYEAEVGSGKDFQQTQADYLSIRGKVKGFEAQLKLLGLNLDRMREGELYEQVPVISPISGYIRFVEIKTGQYVEPQTKMFEVVNIDHIHADLMVFEKDVHRVHEGQKVRFKVESLPDQELEAVIYAVGKSFEQSPKAVHLHAEIENKEGPLIPGMYVRGQILTDSVETFALPNEAVVREGDGHLIFKARKEGHPGSAAWIFEPVNIKIGVQDNGWIEVKLLDHVRSGTQFAWNNAYYLVAEMKKGEGGHGHSH